MKRDATAAGTHRRRGTIACLLGATITAWASTSAGASGPVAPPDGESAALEAKIVQGAGVADLVNLGYRSSPMIRAARAEWRAAVEKYRVDTAWADPELMVEGMYPAEDPGNLAKPMDWSVALSQAIPLWGRQGTAGAVTRAEVRVAKLKADAAVRDMTYGVRRSAAELGYLAAARQIAGDQQELVAKLVAGGAGAYAGQRASLFELMKARAQSGQVAYDVLLLEEAERTERARLNALLDRAPDAPIGAIAGESAAALAFSVSEIDALVETNNDDVLVAGAEAEKAEAMAKLVRYENLPEVSLGVSYGQEDDEKQFGLRAGLMLPLHPGKNAGRLGAAQADIERMRAMYRSRLNETRAKAHDVAFRLKNAERLDALYRDDLIPQAERAIEASQARLDQGQGDLGAAAEARSAWYSFRLARARAQADRGALLAELESLAGRPLTRRDDAAAGPQGGAK